ncbi:hypothetical protein [Candidatus Chloroploca asiatica]|uniref:hypothetical protein n=1 Tax=Candidatus Chloroploca asiatica TaxID=1506545 RepID=UPI00114484D7|nr:hypothetical protein [Candidatus Chloroploca asiatica]
MSMLITLGSCGIGLVWGWLLGSFEGHLRKASLSVPLLAGASLILGGSFVVLYGWVPVIFAGIAAGGAVLLHLGWRQELRRRTSETP